MLPEETSKNRKRSSGSQTSQVSLLAELLLERFQNSLKIVLLPEPVSPTRLSEEITMNESSATCKDDESRGTTYATCMPGFTLKEMCCRAGLGSFFVLPRVG